MLFGAQGDENEGNVKQQLAKLFEVSIRKIVPDEPNVEPEIAVCAAKSGTAKKFGDYQWYIIGCYSKLWILDLF